MKGSDLETGRWRNRIVGEGEEVPDQLLANPQNWRPHPMDQQHALASLLTDVGWVQRVIVNRVTGHVIDGHARISLAISRAEPSIPVLYVELTLDEELIVLASLDPIVGMAGTDKAKLSELLKAAAISDDGLRRHLSAMAGTLESTEWEGMPEYDNEDTSTFQSIHLHFLNQNDVTEFASLIGQSITDTTRTLWFPENEEVKGNVKKHLQSKYI